MGALVRQLRQKKVENAQLCQRAERLESALADAVRALEKIKLRICYIGLPSEKTEDRGDGVMVPVWRDEIAALSAALAKAREVLPKGEVGDNQHHD